MTKKVQAAAAPQVKKVYSNDKKIFLGMTVKDASKSTETMKIFDFADVDKDGQIDKGELDRYNGPIVVQNIETKEARVFGRYDSTIASGCFEGDVIKDTELEYYPGLTIEKVGDKGRVSFTQIDKNHDGKLSKEEVSAVAKELKQLENSIQKMKQLKEAVANTRKIGGGIVIGTSAALGIAGGIVTTEVVGGILTGGASIIVTGAIFGGYMLYKKHQLKNDFEDIKQQFLNSVKSPYVKERAIEEFSKIY